MTEDRGQARRGDGIALIQSNSLFSHRHLQRGKPTGSQRIHPTPRAPHWALSDQSADAAKEQSLVSSHPPEESMLPRHTNYQRSLASLVNDREIEATLALVLGNSKAGAPPGQRAPRSLTDHQRQPKQRNAPLNHPLQQAKPRSNR